MNLSQPEADLTVYPPLPTSTSSPPIVSKLSFGYVSVAFVSYIYANVVWVSENMVMTKRIIVLRPHLPHFEASRCKVLLPNRIPSEGYGIPSE